MFNCKKIIIFKSKSISIRNNKVWCFNNIFFKKKYIKNKKK